MYYGRRGVETIIQQTGTVRVAAWPQCPKYFCEGMGCEID